MGFFRSCDQYSAQSFYDGVALVNMCASSGVATNLTFLGRPAIGLGARAAHQHRSLGIAQAVSLKEKIDGLLVVGDWRSI
jgi:hypothetical protein